MDEPDNMTTPLSDMAAQMHELFTELKHAGFTEVQALTIVIGMARDDDE